MKLVKLTRPALDPQRHLEFQAREAQSGLLDFVLAQSGPEGWIDVELLDEEQPTTPLIRPARHTG